MPRPPIEPGKTGHIHVGELETGSFVARARFRTFDGLLVGIKASGKTSGAAEKALKARIRTRLSESEFLSNTSKIEALASQWLDSKRAQKPPLAPRTLEAYTHAVRAHVVPALGHMALKDVRPPHIERAVLALIASDAPSKAVRFRSVLRDMFGMAIRMGAVAANPVEYTTRYRGERLTPQALTLAELAEVRAIVAAQPEPRTNRRRGASTASVLEFLVGTGCRPAEALGLHWEDVHLEDSIPWVRIRQQVQRLEGTGLVLLPTKGKDVRNLALPTFTASMLRGLPRNPGPVFPSATGGLRDPRSMRRIWDKAFEGSGWEWVTQKVLRKTVATVVAEAEGAELAARQLGHSDDRVTRAHYIAPSTVPLALEAMETLGGVVVSDSRPTLLP